MNFDPQYATIIHDMCQNVYTSRFSDKQYIFSKHCQPEAHHFTYQTSNYTSHAVEHLTGFQSACNTYHAFIMLYIILYQIVSAF